MIREIGPDATNGYVYGLDLSGRLQGAGTIGGILARVDSLATAFYAYDASGNVTELVDANGSISAHYEYDPYGNILTQSGSLATSNPYRFGTKYQDEETGLLYYGFRYYDSRMGRWKNMDPISEKAFHIVKQRELKYSNNRTGISTYDFLCNNPILMLDYLGLLIIPSTNNYVDPGADTIVCKGGQLVVQLGASQGKVYESCSTQHEEQHIKDWKARYGDDVCKGVPDGYLPVGGDGYDAFLKKSECDSYTMSVECIKGLPCPVDKWERINWDYMVKNYESLKNFYCK